MKFSLKKALKVRGALEAFVRNYTVTTSEDLSIFVEANRTNPMTAVVAAEEAARNRMDDMIKASRILATVRALISDENAQGGIDALMTEKAGIEREIAILKPVADTRDHPVEEEIKGEMEAAHTNRDSDSIHSRYLSSKKSVTVSIVSPKWKQEAEKAIVQLRRQLEEVEEKRVVLNYERSIEIAKDDAEFLEKHGIV